MIVKAYTIKEASAELGISERQVRRYIHTGKIEAQLVKGKHGQTYQITSIPPKIAKGEGHRQGRGLTSKVTSAEVKGLEKKNEELHGRIEGLIHELGTLQERIRNQEAQLKLLTEARAKRPWRQRIFNRSG